MPLSAEELEGRLWDGNSAGLAQSSVLAIVPLPDRKALSEGNAASIDLRLGRWFRSMRHSHITVVDPQGDGAEERTTKEHFVRFNDDFVLHPGQFVIGITLEWLNLPHDLSGYVTGKSSWGRRGLIIETAAGIHPGFTGCLTLELANVGAAPIKLRPGMPICQIFLHNVARNSKRASSQFVGHRKPNLGRVTVDAVSQALHKQFFPD